MDNNNLNKIKSNGKTKNGRTTNMNCWHCKTELIWGGDHSIDEDFQPVLAEEYSMVTNLSCPKCNSYVEVYLAK